MNIKILILVLPLILLAACANPFVQFFRPNIYYDASRRSGTPPNTPEVIAGRNPQQDYKNYMEAGYVIIGTSSFNGRSGNYGLDDAIDEGQKVGADLVVVYSHYTNTVSGVIPWTMPHTETSTTNVNGSIYGNQGMTTINGTASTTTYGSQTTYIPYSVNWSNYLAVYLAKVKPRLGAFYNNLDDQERQAVGSNTGVVVTIIVNQSPAFYANILPGDIILKLNDQLVDDVQMFSSALDRFGGKQIVLTIWRRGGIVQKTVTLNQ